MDPTTNLRQQRELARRIIADSYAGRPVNPLASHDLAERALALDKWIAKGGFLPDSWHLAQKGNQ